MSNMSEEEATVITEMKTPEKKISEALETLDSSSSYYTGSAKTKSVFDKDDLHHPGINYH